MWGTPSLHDDTQNFKGDTSFLASVLLLQSVEYFFLDMSNLRTDTVI